jgi:hypothetical protein
MFEKQAWPSDYTELGMPIDFTEHRIRHGSSRSVRRESLSNTSLLIVMFESHDWLRVSTVAGTKIDFSKDPENMSPQFDSAVAVPQTSVSELNKL